MAVGTTKMAQMLDPEVLADMIDAEVGKAIRFAPLAEVDTTLSFATLYHFIIQSLASQLSLKKSLRLSMTSIQIAITQSN